MRRVALLSVAFAALFACGQRYYASEQDAGAGDAGTADAGDDAASVDAASDVASDVAPPFCTTVDAALCADFEDADLPAPFHEVDTSPGSAVVIDPTQGFASARSLHTTMPAAPDAGEVDSLARRVIVTPVSRVVVEEDVFFADPPGWNAGNIALTRLLFHGDSDIGIELYEQPGFTTVTVDEPTFDFFNTLLAMPVGKWTHVKIDWDPRPPSNLEVWFDKDEVLSKQGITFVAQNITTLEVQIGLARFNSPTPAFDVHYDDVAVTLLP